MNEKPIDRDPSGSEPSEDGPPLFANADEEKRYWHSRTPEERLRETERLRRLEYGPAALGPMARVLEVVHLADGYIKPPLRDPQE